jgi:hypothetical protein
LSIARVEIAKTNFYYHMIIFIQKYSPTFDLEIKKTNIVRRKNFVLLQNWNQTGHTTHAK